MVIDLILTVNIPTEKQDNKLLVGPGKLVQRNRLGPRPPDLLMGRLNLGSDRTVLESKQNVDETDLESL